MTVEQIIAVYPELTIEDFAPQNDVISLFDDGDGIVYIKKWNYSKPIPQGMKLGK
jgi:hypothetical protein